MVDEAKIRPPTPPPPIIKLAEPLLEVIGRSRAPSRHELRTQAEMSRARFAVSQFTSVLVAFITCCSLIVVALIKMNNLQDLFSGPCGIGNLIMQQLNVTSPLLPNETCPTEHFKDLFDKIN